MTEIENLRTEIEDLKTSNKELSERIDELWKALTSLSLDMVANKVNIDLICRELIKKERVI